MKKVVSIFIICLIFVTGCSVKKTSEINDSEKFAMEYNVATENPFSYVNYDKLLKLFESDNAIIYFGSSNDENSQTIAKFLTEAFEKKNINDIYYFDPTKLNKKDKKQLIDVINSKTNDDIDNIKIPSLYLIKDKVTTSLVEEIDSQELEEQNDLGQDEKERIKKRYIELLKE